MSARINIYRPEVDADSVDIGFAVRSIAGRLRPPRLEAQLKCTTKADGDEVSLRFKLEVKNYNDLRGEHFVPRLLIVVVVPKRPQDWLTQITNHLPYIAAATICRCETCPRRLTRRASP